MKNIWFFLLFSMMPFVLVCTDLSVTTLNDARVLFSLDQQKIEQRVNELSHEAQNVIASFVGLKPEERTFSNTMYPMDDYLAQASSFLSALSILAMAHPDENLRAIAAKNLQDLQNVISAYFVQNQSILNAYKEYYEGNFIKEKLTEAEQKIMKDSMEQLKKGGFDLSPEKKERLLLLSQEIGQLSADFSRAIQEDESFVVLKKSELVGAKQSFIDSLEIMSDDRYKVPVTIASYEEIIDMVASPEGRKKMFQAFNNRAYPSNEDLLKQIIEKRDETASLLGYSSYAAMDFEETMAEVPEVAERFLFDLVKKAQPRAREEFLELLNVKPDDVMLTPDGKMQPWDLPYCLQEYKSDRILKPDDSLRDYFVYEPTINALLKLYEDFFDISLSFVRASKFWHSDVRAIEVKNRATKKLMGFILLDLFPRKGKYTHALTSPIVPALLSAGGKRNSALVVMLTNFIPTKKANKILLEKEDVTTFFHELGHALHTLFGATRLSSQSGTHVAPDFLEMPSQMLEGWMTDEEVLKKISRHYKTGKPLSSERIKQINNYHKFFSVNSVLHTAYQSLFSLEIFKPGAQKDIEDIKRRLWTKIFPYLEFDPEDHFEATFEHLIGYGAKYYGYLWSKVYAVDIFEHIKKYGLSNPVIGKQYVEKVLMPGGSNDALDMITAFLGRAPSIDAFFADIGI